MELRGWQVRKDCPDQKVILVRLAPQDRKVFKVLLEFRGLSGRLVLQVLRD